MVIDRNKTIAFSGHRKINPTLQQTLFCEENNISDKVSYTSEFASTNPFLEKVGIQLKETVLTHIENGYDTFLCGLAEGFDLAAGIVVSEIKGEIGNIRLIGAIPFPEQARYFNDPTKEQYQFVLDSCDHTAIICPNYSKDCFHRRNDFLVSNSNSLICYFDGTKGGTAYTVRKAFVDGLKITNLFR